MPSPFAPLDNNSGLIEGQPGAVPQMDDDFLSVFLNETVPGTGTFEIGQDGSVREVSPEDDYLPAVSSPQHHDNLADRDQIPEGELAKIATALLDAIDDDIESRAPWVDRFRTGFEMMGLTPDEIDDGPFPGSSTAVMPVISEAVVQFWARSLAEQVPSGGPAKGTILGKAHQGQLDRAKRVAEYMNHDMMFLDRPWYGDHSRMLFALPYTGSCFKKTYRDGDRGRNTGVYVQAEDFITNYSFSDLDSAPRYAHRIWRTRNDIRKSQVAGVYRDVDLQDAPIEELPEETQIKIDSSDFSSTDQGRMGDQRHELFEVYCEWDLPGFEDVDQSGQPTGIALPYIITLDKHTEKILSVYRGWKENDPLKRRQVNFTKYDYLPGPGFYGYGLFHMIGGLQQAATGALRAVIDGAATASLQGGFISKDASMKDQNLTIEPGVWKQVDATAEDLGKAFFTPPFKEPSPVLFQVMGFLVQRAEKFAATTEMQTGTENAKNMPVGSTVAMLEAGSKVFSTIHRGLHKALSEEMRQRYELIQMYMPEQGYPYDVEGGHEGVFAEDFAPGVTVIPVSDPNIFSQTQRVALNQAVYDLATQNPDILKRPAVVRRVLEGLNVPDIESLLVSNEPPAPMDPVSEIQALLRGEPVQAYPDQMHQAYIQHYWAFMNNPGFGGNPQIQERIGPAAIALLGQRLAYAWAEHVRAQGVPAPMLPPPIQPEDQQQGQGGPQMPQGGQMQPGQPQPPTSDQIAQMAAQIAPNMVQVPGLPLPPQTGGEQKGLAPEQEAQFRDRETAAKEQESQAKIGAIGAKAAGEQKTAELKAAIEYEKLQQHQIDTQAKAQREARLARQDEAQQAAKEQELMQNAQAIQQADEQHRLKAIKALEDAETERTMQQIQGAITAQQAQDAARQAELDRQATKVDIQVTKKKAAEKPPKPKPGKK